MPDELEAVQYRQRYETYKMVEEKEVDVRGIHDGGRGHLPCGASALLPASPRTRLTRHESKGIKVGMISPITLWPFPKKRLSRGIADRSRLSSSVELTMGQMIEDVEPCHRRASRPVLSLQPRGRYDPVVENVLEAKSEEKSTEV